MVIFRNSSFFFCPFILYFPLFLIVFHGFLLPIKTNEWKKWDLLWFAYFILCVVFKSNDLLLKTAESFHSCLVNKSCAFYWGFLRWLFKEKKLLKWLQTISFLFIYFLTILFTLDNSFNWYCQNRQKGRFKGMLDSQTMPFKS